MTRPTLAVLFPQSPEKHLVYLELNSTKPITNTITRNLIIANIPENTALCCFFEISYLACVFMCVLEGCKSWLISSDTLCSCALNIWSFPLKNTLCQSGSSTTITQAAVATAISQTALKIRILKKPFVHARATAYIAYVQLMVQ